MEFVWFGFLLLKTDPCFGLLGCYMCRISISVSCAVLLTSFSLCREAQVNTKITVNLFYGKLTSREEAERHFHKPVITACHCSVARISLEMTKWFEVYKNIWGPLFIQGRGQMGSGVWQAYMNVMVVWKWEWMKPKLEQDVCIKAKHGTKKDYYLSIVEVNWFYSSCEGWYWEMFG